MSKLSEPSSTVQVTPGVGLSRKKALQWRRAKTLELISNAIMLVSELANMMHVSESTIKRDRKAITREARKQLQYGSYDNQIMLMYSLYGSAVFKNLQVACEIRDNEKLDANSRLQGIHDANKCLEMIVEHTNNDGNLAHFYKSVDQHISDKIAQVTGHKLIALETEYQNKNKQIEFDKQRLQSQIQSKDKEICVLKDQINLS